MRLRASAAVHIQPVKSISATLLVVAGSTYKGCPMALLEVIFSEGLQSATPPLLGWAACASTVNGTLPPAGVE